MLPKYLFFYLPYICMTDKAIRKNTDTLFWRKTSQPAVSFLTIDNWRFFLEQFLGTLILSFIWHVRIWIFVDPVPKFQLSHAVLFCTVRCNINSHFIFYLYLHLSILSRFFYTRSNPLVILTKRLDMMRHNLTEGTFRFNYFLFFIILQYLLVSDSRN